MANENLMIGRAQLGKEEIYTMLKEQGFRLTEQRKTIVDVIVNEDYSCCKEVYIMAHKRDESIGIATVYRMIQVLEELGAISRKNLTKNACSGRCCDMKGGCTVVTDKSKQIFLSEEDIQEALKYIMDKNGYTNVDEIKAVLVNQTV